MRVDSRARGQQRVGDGAAQVDDDDFPAAGAVRPSARSSVPARPAGPCARMPTRLHSSSASDRMCELNSTVRPSSRSRGSSRAPRGGRSDRDPTSARRESTSSGSLTSACASPTRCTMPFEYWRSGRRRSAPSPTRSSTRAARRAALRAAIAEQAREIRRAVPRRSGGRRSRDARAGSRGAGARASRPAAARAARRVPDVGRSRFSSSLRVVLLPAPFGPSRPKTPPGGNLERQVVERAMRPRTPEAGREVLGQAFGANDGRHARCGGVRRLLAPPSSARC